MAQAQHSAAHNLACAREVEEMLTALPPLPADACATYSGRALSFATVGVFSDASPTGSARRDPSSGSPLDAAPGTPPGGNSAFIPVRVLGRGGMGEVWVAWQRSLDRQVAIKRVRIERLVGSAEDDRDFRRIQEEFEREALVAASLEHPNIVPVHDFALDSDGNAVMAMKLVQGRPWDRLLRQDFAELGVEAFLARHLPILVSMTQAVAFAHSRGVVHRDLKPAQVMVGDFGEVLLMDWGLAVRVGDPPAEGPIPPRRHGSHVRDATNPCGTPALMAPEQTFPTAEGIGPWTDVYLLGGTLYHLLTGTFPHEAGTAALSMMLARAGDVTPPCVRAPGRAIPAPLESLALRALAPRPQERVASAREFLEALQDYLTGESRRRESAAISTAVRTRFEAAAEHGYGMLAELEGQLAQARSLWSGNPEIAPLEARILAAHASTALGHGDVTLARHLAERLPADAGRAPLLESVSSAESRLRRARRTRRALVAATIALLMVVVAGFAGFSWKLEQERAREAAAREAEFAAKLRANRARERGDELVNFMLGDLRDSLKQLRRLDLLDSAVERALEHYRSTAADAATEQDVARSLEGLVNCARTLSEQGRNSAALPVLRQALEMTRHPHIADPDSVEWLDYRMQVLNEVGLASSNQGRKDEGLASLTESVGIGESLVARAPDRPDILRRLGVAYSHRGMIHEDALEFKEARADYERSLEIQRRLYAAKPLRYDTGISLSRALSTMGNMYSREGDFDRAEAAFLEALGIGRAVREADPDIPRERLQELRSDEVIVLSLLGNIEENRREWKASLARYDDATSKALALFNEDPTNAMHKQHLVVLSYFASRAAAMLGNTEEAIGRLRSSLGIVRELLDRDPANVDSQQQFMLISSRLASILENRGRFEESYSISASILQTVGDGPLFDGEARLTRGRRKAMLTLVRNLQQLGRYQESLDAAAPLLRSRPRDLRDPVDFDAAQDLALAHALAAHACLVLRCGEQTATYLANAESLVDIAREIPRADIRFTELICSILRARIAEREGDREAMLAAHGHIRRLMEEEPDFRNSIFAINPLVLVHIQLGEVDQARELRRNMPRRPPQLDPFFFSYANETGWKD